MLEIGQVKWLRCLDLMQFDESRWLELHFTTAGTGFGQNGTLYAGEPLSMQDGGFHPSYQKE